MEKKTVEKLIAGLGLHSSKKPSAKRSSSIAISQSGQEYIASRVETDTHLLNTTSEQNALMLSVLNKDYKVHKIVTLFESPEMNVLIDPIVIKTIIDYQIRTGVAIEYSILDTNGTTLFETKDVRSIFPAYNPKAVPLKMVSENGDPSTNKAKITTSNCVDATPDIHSHESLSERRSEYTSFNDTQRRKKRRPSEQSRPSELGRSWMSGNECQGLLLAELKKYAILGVTRNFPQYDSASGYGTAILTKSGKIYFGGQYSSFDHRLGFHSEMTTIISSLMDGENDITHLGIVSTKYKDSPCDCCGICRQFISEMAVRYDWNLKIFNFALDTDDCRENSIKDYLPSQWSNKK